MNPRPLNTAIVRMGVIGLGTMGASHARRLAAGQIPGLTLSAVCDPCADLCAEFQSAAAYPTAHALFKSGEIDAVLIATPHPTHVPLGIAALEAGLHVLMEKPIAVYTAEACKLLAAHNSAGGQIFAAMFNQRTDPRYTRLKSLIDSGELGAVQRIAWTITDWYRTDTYYKSSSWRATWPGEGGGLLLNQCPHQLDLWQWLFGMPSSVMAVCQFGRFHPIEVEDSVTAILSYPSGTQGVFVASTGEAPGENRLSIAADRGLLIADADGVRFRRTEIPVPEHRRTSSASFATPPLWDVAIPIEGAGEQHAGILKNFAAAILHGDPLLAPAADGFASLELANAMLLSSLRNAPVPLPLDEAAYERELQTLIAASTSRAARPQS